MVGNGDMLAHAASRGTDHRNSRTSLIAVGAVVIVMVFVLDSRAEPFAGTVSVQRNSNADPLVAGHDVTLSRYEVPQSPIQWSVKKSRMYGGKQEGTDVIWVDNGKLQIGVIVTRGLGIQAVNMNGTQVLGWDSPVKEVVHPKFINLNSRGGLGWLEGFNEWLCRCGMEWNGHPGPTNSSTTWVRKPPWT